jgi:hypothetical protein
MKLTLTFWALLFSVASTFGQIIQFHAGVTSAANASFVLDKGLSEDPRYNATYEVSYAPIGVSFGANLGRKFGISLEGIKSAQGQVYELIDAAQKVKGERKIDLEYIHLPMLFKFMSGGNAGARANFNIGPQLSFLTDARETIAAQAGIYQMPEGATIEGIQQEFPTAIDKGDGTYEIPNDMPSRDLLTRKSNDFKNSEFAIAAAFGLDIDLSKHLYLTTQIRANYSLTDIRNGDVIDRIKNSDAASLFGERANLLVGVQIGVHYMFGTTRSFRSK